MCMQARYYYNTNPLVSNNCILLFRPNAIKQSSIRICFQSGILQSGNLQSGNLQSGKAEDDHSSPCFTNVTHAILRVKVTSQPGNSQPGSEVLLPSLGIPSLGRALTGPSQMKPFHSAHASAKHDRWPIGRGIRSPHYGCRTTYNLSSFWIV